MTTHSGQRGQLVIAKGIRTERTLQSSDAFEIIADEDNADLILLRRIWPDPNAGLVRHLVDCPHRGVLRALILAAALFCTWGPRALADPLSVTCTNDGNGLYSYTFAQGDDPYVWGIGGTATLSMPSYGVLQTFQPPGWSATLDPDGWISWQVTNGLVYLEDPVTLAVRSTFTASRLYDGAYGASPFPAGYIVGVVYSLPDHVAFLGGYEAFPFIGPDPIPPPLNIQRVGGSVVLSWRAPAGGFNLETTRDLSPASQWSVVTNVPVIFDSKNFVTNAASARAQFYRLR
jgi:hypothetical protein